MVVKVKTSDRQSNNIRLGPSKTNLCPFCTKMSSSPCAVLAGLRASSKGMLSYTSPLDSDTSPAAKLASVLLTRLATVCVSHKYSNSYLFCCRSFWISYHSHLPCPLRPLRLLTNEASVFPSHITHPHLSHPHTTHPPPLGEVIASISIVTAWTWPRRLLPWQPEGIPPASPWESSLSWTTCNKSSTKRSSPLTIVSWSRCTKALGNRILRPVILLWAPTFGLAHSTADRLSNKYMYMYSSFVNRICSNYRTQTPNDLYYNYLSHKSKPFFYT